MIRTALSADLDAIAALHTRARATYYPWPDPRGRLRRRGRTRADARGLVAGGRPGRGRGRGAVRRAGRAAHGGRRLPHGGRRDDAHPAARGPGPLAPGHRGRPARGLRRRVAAGRDRPGSGWRSTNTTSGPRPSTPGRAGTRIRRVRSGPARTSRCGSASGPGNATPRQVVEPETAHHGTSRPGTRREKDHARRDLERHRLPLVLHRQGPLREGRWPTSRTATRSRSCYRSFELDPDAAKGTTAPVLEMLAKKYGRTPKRRAAGGERRRERAGRGADVPHRRPRPRQHLRHPPPAAPGQAPAAARSELLDLAYRANFARSGPCSTREVLVALAVEAGLDEAEARTVLADPTPTPPRCGPTSARRRNSAPTPCRSSSSTAAYGVSGGQPAEVFTQALEQAWAGREVPRARRRSRGLHPGRRLPGPPVLTKARPGPGLPAAPAPGNPVSAGFPTRRPPRRPGHRRGPSRGPWPGPSGT